MIAAGRQSTAILLLFGKVYILTLIVLDNLPVAFRFGTLVYDNVSVGIGMLFLFVLKITLEAMNGAVNLPVETIDNPTDNRQESDKNEEGKLEEKHRLLLNEVNFTF